MSLGCFLKHPQITNQQLTDARACITNPIGVLSFDTAIKNKRRDKPPNGNLFLHNSFSLQLFKKAKWRFFPVSSTQKRESPEAL